jgi:hypothetical protein
MERGFVDIKVKQDAKVTLIEVKTDLSPRYAVREALGQLLEYEYWCGLKREKVAELVVAGPGELQELDRAYLTHLQRVRKLPIRYVHFRRGSKDVDL